MQRSNWLTISLVIVLFLMFVGLGAYLLGKQTRVLPSPTPTLTALPTFIPFTFETITPMPSPSPKAKKTPIPNPTKTPTSSPTSSPTPIVFQVTNVVATSSVIGATCPKTVNFSANITTNSAGDVTYKWERSDGATAPTETKTFVGAGTQTVTSTWTLSAEGTKWKKVHLLTPNDISSNEALFTIDCP